MSREITNSNYYSEILSTIKSAQKKVFQKLNSSLLELYWDIGKYISNKTETEQWGKSVVEELSNYLKQNDPELKGFSSRNIWRMKQFYEVYKDSRKLSTLWSQISWSHNRTIMILKSPEEREFYLKICSKNNYSVRELEKIISTSTYERTILAQNNSSKTILKNPNDTLHVFKDSYIFDFLNLPKIYKEKELQNALVKSLKGFILELGKGFSFIGQEYRLQVGNEDFFLDLLFYHRELQCLVAIELKTTKFKPQHLGQLEFYLEALDRDVKLPKENSSIGILLCREKDNEVVEYALRRSVSPAVISEYETKLIPKELLRKKLNEFYNYIDKK